MQERIIGHNTWRPSRVGRQYFHTAASAFIVTGDNDLLRLGEYQGIRILTVAELLNLVRLPLE